MASPYTPSAVKLSGTVVLPDDGDTIEAADVNVPAAAALDGVLYATKGGPDRLDVLANLAALTAIAAPADGLVRHVLGQGLYVFQLGGSATLSPFAIADDGATGAWVASNAHEVTKTLIVPCGHARCVSGDSGTPGEVLTTLVTTWPGWCPLRPADADVGPLGLYPLVVYTGGTDNTARMYLVPIDDFLIDGSTLTSAVLSYRPVGGHGALPNVQPLLAIARTPLTGYVQAPQKMVAGTSGFAGNLAASVVAYQADRTITFTPTTNNVIDRTLYSYVAVIADEGGTNAIAGSRFAAIALTMTMTDARRS